MTFSRIKSYCHRTLWFAAVSALTFLAPGSGRMDAAERTLTPREQIAELKLKLKDIQDRQREDQDFFDRFMKDKKILVDQKQKEKAGVEKDVAALEAKNLLQRQRSRELQLGIDKLAADDKNLAARILGHTAQLRDKITRGIPFEKDRRLSVITSLDADIKGGTSSALEAVNRISSFFDTEDILAYDSQSLQSVEEIGGERLNVNLLRIGRVFFAADTGTEVYLYKKSGDDWV
ncbi:MAG: DUF3450 family protein, partial [Spirochaetia bacterium]|nr:DUF3450 family protein [Spirochaetia bacterium]